VKRIIKKLLSCLQKITLVPKTIKKYKRKLHKTENEYEEGYLCMAQKGGDPDWWRVKKTT
jgi:hypothetical protein